MRDHKINNNNNGDSQEEKKREIKLIEAIEVVEEAMSTITIIKIEVAMKAMAEEAMGMEEDTQMEEEVVINSNISRRGILENFRKIPISL